MSTHGYGVCLRALGVPCELLLWPRHVQGRNKHEELSHIEAIEVDLLRGDKVEPSSFFSFSFHCVSDGM